MVLSGGPVPAGGAALATQGGQRTPNYCVLGKQSILLMLLLLPGHQCPGQGEPRALLSGCLHLLRRSAGNLRPAEGLPAAPAFPRLRRGLLQGGKSGVVGCTVPPHHPRGRKALVGRQGRAAAGPPASTLLHPALPPPQPVPRPAGTRLPVRGESDEVMLLNITISSQPFSPATRPGCRRLPALAEPPVRLPPPLSRSAPADGARDAGPKGRRRGDARCQDRTVPGRTVPGATVPPSGHRGREDARLSPPTPAPDLSDTLDPSRPQRPRAVNLGAGSCFFPPSLSPAKCLPFPSKFSFFFPLSFSLWYL